MLLCRLGAAKGLLFSYYSRRSLPRDYSRAVTRCSAQRARRKFRDVPRSLTRTEHRPQRNEGTHLKRTLLTVALCTALFNVACAEEKSQGKLLDVAAPS